MSARVLVVDDTPVNVRILEAKLTASYFIVLKAYSGAEALEIAAKEQPDLILLDVMMPGMDGYECCRRLKANPHLSHIPVVMVTALDQISDRVRGLEAGADDFLTKPPNDLALFARVRSLVRMKMMFDELRARDDTIRVFGGDGALSSTGETLSNAEVTIVEESASRASIMARALSNHLPVKTHIATDDEALAALTLSGATDLFIIPSWIEGVDGLRLCSQLRSAPETRQSGILMVVEDGAFETIASALDLGVSDYVMRPIDESELITRVRSQLVRKSYADRLRADLNANLRMAVTDGLTGLYNRRYADQHLVRQSDNAMSSGAPSSVLMLDIDRFKSVNDTYGHAVGDEVLIEVAKRLQQAVRSFDLVARYGGEEFIVVMPDTAEAEAIAVGERVRAMVADAPISVRNAPNGSIDVTISVGAAEFGRDPSPRDCLERADRALYASKSNGRNRVTGASALKGIAVA